MHAFLEHFEWSQCFKTGCTSALHSGSLLCGEKRNIRKVENFTSTLCGWKNDTSKFEIDFKSSKALMK